MELNDGHQSGDEPATKRRRTDEPIEQPATSNDTGRLRGIASVKSEFLISHSMDRRDTAARAQIDDDVQEGRLRADDPNNTNNYMKKKKKAKGQNTDRQFGHWGDKIQLCNSRANSAEFSPKECRFGDSCKLCHDLRKYLNEGKREALTTFGGKCPVWEINGVCHAGWKCRFVDSHSEEIAREDGRKELVLITDPERVQNVEHDGNENRKGVFNVIGAADKLALSRRQIKTDRADEYSLWLEKLSKEIDKRHQEWRANLTNESNQALEAQGDENGMDVESEPKANAQTTIANSHEPSAKMIEEDNELLTKHTQKDIELEENRAQFADPPFLPSEKRRLYFGPETPVLAPLTTQGNLPFRRLCVDFGAQLTYSEMAMSMPLIQGQKTEWALLKAHESELIPPKYSPQTIVKDYDNSRDLKFGAQISANKPWSASKAAEVLAKLVPHLRVIDLNCGCPIDLVFRQGSGSALLDSPGKLERIVRSMNAVSGEIPITTKIRTGISMGKPTALKNIERLAFGAPHMRTQLGAPGCAAITLHGRSRQQRYTKQADWAYIAECATLVKSYETAKDKLTDTIQEPDARTLPNTPEGKMYFIGNGDCYSHVDYLEHVQSAKVDSVMVARGAMIKPWIFEEIEKGQYLDKSASERLVYVEKFSRYGLEAWGSDEVGIGQTRRFLLEWLSFAHRYVPIGILEHLPPSLQDRPPAFRGRDDLETLLASDNYLDWIKISEMFLGPAHKDFRFQPKHKSNSYEIEAEG